MDLPVTNQHSIIIIKRHKSPQIISTMSRKHKTWVQSKNAKHAKFHTGLIAAIGIA